MRWLFFCVIEVLIKLCVVAFGIRSPPLEMLVCVVCQRAEVEVVAKRTTNRSAGADVHKRTS